MNLGGQNPHWLWECQAGGQMVSWFHLEECRQGTLIY